MQQIERLRNGLRVAEVEGGITDSSRMIKADAENGSSTSDLNQLQRELELANGRARRAGEQVSSLEAQVNRLELELELAQIKIDGQGPVANVASVTQAATAHGSVMVRKEQSLMESSHLRKAIVRLEAEHAAQEQSHAQELFEMSSRLAAARAEAASYQRRLEVAGAETASVVATREDLVSEIAAERQRYESVQATVDVQRLSIKKMYKELRAVRLQAFAIESMAKLREGAWLTKYAHNTFKVKRIFAHVRDGRLYWGKKPADTGGSSIELKRVRSIKFGHTNSQLKHIGQNASLALNRRRAVHDPWHCVTVYMDDGKEVSLAGPLNDEEAATSTRAEPATRGAASIEAVNGCHDMIVWCAGLSAHVVCQQQPQIEGDRNGTRFKQAAQNDFDGTVAVPSQGALLWARCRMRVDRKATERNTYVIHAFVHMHTYTCIITASLEQEASAAVSSCGYIYTVVVCTQVSAKSCHSCPSQWPVATITLLRDRGLFSLSAVLGSIHFISRSPVLRTGCHKGRTHPQRSAFCFASSSVFLMSPYAIECGFRASCSSEHDIPQPTRACKYTSAGQVTFESSRRKR